MKQRKHFSPQISHDDEGNWKVSNLQEGFFWVIPELYQLMNTDDFEVLWLPYRYQPTGVINPYSSALEYWCHLPL